MNMLTTVHLNWRPSSSIQFTWNSEPELSQAYNQEEEKIKKDIKILEKCEKLKYVLQ